MGGKIATGKNRSKTLLSACSVNCLEKHSRLARRLLSISIMMSDVGAVRLKLVSLMSIRHQ